MLGRMLECVCVVCVCVCAGVERGTHAGTDCHQPTRSSEHCPLQLQGVFFHSNAMVHGV